MNGSCGESVSRKRCGRGTSEPFTSASCKIYCFVIFWFCFWNKKYAWSLQKKKIHVVRTQEQKTLRAKKKKGLHFGQTKLVHGAGCRTRADSWPCSYLHPQKTETRVAATIKRTWNR